MHIKLFDKDKVRIDLVPDELSILGISVVNPTSTTVDSLEWIAHRTLIELRERFGLYDENNGRFQIMLLIAEEVTSILVLPHHSDTRSVHPPKLDCPCSRCQAWRDSIGEPLFETDIEVNESLFDMDEPEDDDDDPSSDVNEYYRQKRLSLLRNIFGLQNMTSGEAVSPTGISTESETDIGPTTFEDAEDYPPGREPVDTSKLNDSENHSPETHLTGDLVTDFAPEEVLVFRTNNFEDLITLSKSPFVEQLNHCRLYTYKNVYYLAVFHTGVAFVGAYMTIDSVIKEYLHNTDVKVPLLEDYGKIILSDNAFAEIRSHFK